MENIIFEITDKSGRQIYLTKERWGHIQKHPEMSNQVENIKNTLKRPLTIRKFEYDAEVRYYYSYFKNRDGAKYLLVLVKYLNGNGFIISAYYTTKIEGLK